MYTEISNHGFNSCERKALASVHVTKLSIPQFAESVFQRSNTAGRLGGIELEE